MTIEQVSDLYKVSEYMGDDELSQALEFVARLIIDPTLSRSDLVMWLVKLQAITTKVALQATWYANVDKSDRPKKNLYYTAAEQLNLLCQTLKYVVK